MHHEHMRNPPPAMHSHWRDEKQNVACPRQAKRMPRQYRQWEISRVVYSFLLAKALWNTLAEFEVIQRTLLAQMTCACQPPGSPDRTTLLLYAHAAFRQQQPS